MTTTDDKGEYSFPEVVPGTWVVAVGAGPLSADGRDIPVIVWTFTQKDAGGDDTKDSDVLLSPRLQNKAGISDPVEIKRDDKADIDAGVFRDEPSASPSASPSTEPSASEPPPSEPKPGTGGGKLPKTGFAIGGFLLAGAVLIGGGTVLTLAARKRRPTP
jgi:LPXTG-motif cell wall-anchored protein